MRIYTSQEARDDLRRIYAHLVDRNPQAADALVREIDERFQNISRFPFIGRERSSLAPGLRSVLVGTHLIFYPVEHDRIIVVGVIDGRMDIDEEFKR